MPSVSAFVKRLLLSHGVISESKSIAAGNAHHPKREIEIEEELAKIEAEIDREIERDRKRPHKLTLKSKPRPPWTSPPE
jgi:hypothetical protein